MAWTHKKGGHLSPEARAKISKALKGRHHPGHALSSATRAKISAALKGKHHRGHSLSASTRAKISAALRGKKHPHKGHALSASTRAKISAALKARHGASPRIMSKLPRAAGTSGRRRAVSAKSLASLRHPKRGGPHRYTLARGFHTHKFHGGPHRLISSATPHKRSGLVHARRKHRHRPVIHRHARHHKVWHRHKRKR